MTINTASGSPSKTSRRRRTIGVACLALGLIAATTQTAAAAPNGTSTRIFEIQKGATTAYGSAYSYDVNGKKQFTNVTLSLGSWTSSTVKVKSAKFCFMTNGPAKAIRLWAFTPDVNGNNWDDGIYKIYVNTKCETVSINKTYKVLNTREFFRLTVNIDSRPRTTHIMSFNRK